MAKATILVSLALFACWMALTPLVHCAGEENRNVEENDKKKSDSSHSEAPLNIAKEQKKLSKEVRFLRDSTQKQMDKLKENIKRVEDDIWSIQKRADVVKMNAEELAEIQRVTEEIMKDLGMEVQQSAELSVESTRKTIEKIKAVCTAEVAKMDAKRDRLTAEYDAQDKEFRAKAKAKFNAKFNEKIKAAQKALDEHVGQFERDGGHIEDLVKGYIGSDQPHAEFHNEIVELKRDLDSCKRDAAKFSIYHKFCASEEAQIDAAYDQWVKQMEELDDKRLFEKHLDKIKFLEGKMYWPEKNKNMKLPKPEELQAVEEMQVKLKDLKTEFDVLHTNDWLCMILAGLVDCLSSPLEEGCKNRREEAKRLGQKVAQSENERSNSDQQKSAHSKPSSLMEGIGKLFGHGHNEKKLSTCVTAVIQVYDRAVEEERKKRRVSFTS